MEKTHPAVGVVGVVVRDGERGLGVEGGVDDRGLLVVAAGRGRAGRGLAVVLGRGRRRAGW